MSKIGGRIPPRLLSAAFALAMLLLPAGATAQYERTPITIVGVTDGDTITVAFTDGAREQIRLIGIDTPETRHPSRPVECFGREATARTTALALGRSAELELDVQQRDRYRRLLGYVWIDGTMLNMQLAAEGFAVQSTYPPNVRYVDDFGQAVASAREEGLGLWSACPSPGLPAAEIEPTVEDGEQPPPAQSGTCDGSYPDVCIPPPPPDLNCGHIPYRRFRVLPPDPHRFDGDRDGLGCERSSTRTDEFEVAQGGLA